MVSCDPTVSLQEQGLPLILFSLPHCRAEHRAGLPGHHPMVMPKVLACLELVPVTSLCLQNEATKGPCAHCPGPPGLWSPRPIQCTGSPVPGAPTSLPPLFRTTCAFFRDQFKRDRLPCSPPLCPSPSILCSPATCPHHRTLIPAFQMGVSVSVLFQPQPEVPGT